MNETENREQMPEPEAPKQEEMPKQEETMKQEEAPKTGDTSSDVKGMVAQLEALLDEYMVEKAPFTLPDNIKDIIVKVAPYLALIAAIAVIPVVLAGLGLSAAMTPFAMMGAYSFSLIAFISAIAALVSLIMELMAVPGLFKRTKKGWRLLFYASIVSLIGSLLSIVNIFGGIIGAIIGWYFLFQIKARYTN